MRCTTVFVVAVLFGCAGAENPPVLVGTAESAYPTAARRAGIEGYVIVAYDLTSDGAVANARVVESEPRGVFDEAALATVSKWRFEASDAERPGSRVSRLTYSLGDADDYGGYD